MRTPQDLAVLIHREMTQGSLHVNTWDNQLAALLTEWRDECLEERLGELMASHDITRADRDRLREDVRQLRDQGSKTLPSLIKLMQGMHEHEVQALCAEAAALQEMLDHDALIIESLKRENVLALRYRRALEIIASYIGHDEGARVCQQTARNALKGGEP
jgi:hypothetical protein